MSPALSRLSRLAPRLSLGIQASRRLSGSSFHGNKVQHDQMPDPLELAKDVDDPVYAQLSEEERAQRRARYQPLQREVDLDTEFDRDDFEAMVQTEQELRARRRAEPLGRPVDLDAELDLSPAAEPEGAGGGAAGPAKG